jgi:hypothetical protein
MGLLAFQMYIRLSGFAGHIGLNQTTQTLLLSLAFFRCNALAIGIRLLWSRQSHK